jgi:hypothetical protein
VRTEWRPISYDREGAIGLSSRRSNFTSENRGSENDCNKSFGAQGGKSCSRALHVVSPSRGSDQSESGIGSISGGRPEQPSPTCFESSRIDRSFNSATCRKLLPFRCRIGPSLVGRGALVLGLKHASRQAPQPAKTGVNALMTRLRMSPHADEGQVGEP